MYWYEFSVQVSEGKKEIIGLDLNNLLEDEFTNNTYRGIIVDKSEYVYGAEMIEKYLDTMYNLSFPDERKNPIFTNAKVYYSVY